MKLFFFLSFCGSKTCSNKALPAFLTISVQRDKVHASFSLSFFHHALLNEPQSAALAAWLPGDLNLGRQRKKGGGATIASHTSAKLIKPAAAAASERADLSKRRSLAYTSAGRKLPHSDNPCVRYLTVISSLVLIQHLKLIRYQRQRQRSPKISKCRTADKESYIEIERTCAT